MMEEKGREPVQHLPQRRAVDILIDVDVGRRLVVVDGVKWAILDEAPPVRSGAPHDEPLPRDEQDPEAAAVAEGDRATEEASTHRANVDALRPPRLAHALEHRLEVVEA